MLGAVGALVFSCSGGLKPSPDAGFEPQCIGAYKPDGGHQGDAAARIIVTVTTACGTFGSTLIAPYTGWQVSG